MVIKIQDFTKNNPPSAAPQGDPSQAPKIPEALAPKEPVPTGGIVTAPEGPVVPQGGEVVVPKTAPSGDDPAKVAPDAPLIQFSKPALAGHMITGDAKRTALDQVKAQAELRKKLRGGDREFWLNPGEFARLYFLDGVLQADGLFDTPMVEIHMVQIGGDFAKFICNKHTEGDCVVCDSNEPRTRVSTITLFSVVNTMPWTIQNGPNKGKTLPARLQLFPANIRTVEKLVKRAGLRGGLLAGNMFQFSRSTKQDANTGDDIEFVQSVPMASVLAKYPLLGDNDADGKPTPTTPLDYNFSYPILTNAEIAALRPDLAHAAGWTTVGGVTNIVHATQSSVGEINADEVPF